MLKNREFMECSNCGHPIEEPEVSHGMDCPGCGTHLLVPSRKDWQSMKDNSLLTFK